MKNKKKVKWIQVRVDRQRVKLVRFLFSSFMVGFCLFFINCNCEPLELPDTKAFQRVKSETFNDMS